MISDAHRRVLVSSLGWIDHDALWVFDTRTRRETRLPLNSSARYLTLFAGDSDRFAVGHHWEGERFELAVHDFAEPGRALARAIIESGGTSFTGEPAAWRDVPLVHVEYLQFPPWSDFVLVVIHPERAATEIQRLGWYDDSYDKGYQGVIEVLPLPGEDVALFSVQRSSMLVVFDLRTGQRTGSIELGGRGGNPHLQLRSGADEIWASDYDSIVVLDRQSHRVLRSRRLQDSSAGTRQFIGSFALDPSGATCLVARPFSGDVIEIDASTLETQRRVMLGDKPLEALALHGGEVVARDWKTGQLLQGTLKR